MRNLLHKILSALNLNRRDWVVFLLALLLAFSIWLIHNLSLKYNDYLSVSVVAQCNIPGHAYRSANRCEVTARCRATGYKLIRSYINRRKSHTVTFRASEMSHYEDDIYYILSSELMNNTSKIYGQGVTVEAYLSDTLFFRFPAETFKKVPVSAISSIKFKNQYMPETSLSVQPDSVFVYGEPYRLESIEAVYTKPINYSSVSEDIRGVASLEKIKGVRLSEDQVRYSMNVKRFVEISCMLPVRVAHLPSDKTMKLYPSSAQVTLRCNFPLSEDPERGLSLEVDYNDYLNSLGGKCMLHLVGASRGIISYEIDPSYVSAIVEDARP